MKSAQKYGVFSGPNKGKYGPEKTPYLDTFYVVKLHEIQKYWIIYSKYVKFKFGDGYFLSPSDNIYIIKNFLTLSYVLL